jgi:putative ABC transport system permease protein
MILASLRDLQYRFRRFLITILGTALVFALTLLISGMSSAFDLEVARTVDSLAVDGWVVSEEAHGPFVSAAPFPVESMDLIRSDAGRAEVGPMIFGRATLEGDDLEDVTVFGSDGVGMPVADVGEAPTERGDTMVSSALGLGVGDTLALGNEDLAVVGVKNDSTALAGTPNVFLGIDDAQSVAFGGAPVVSSVAFVGSPEEVPEGFVVVDNDDAIADISRPTKKAGGGIAMVAILLWFVAAAIIGSVVYLSALEREPDFAVFKATGWSTRSLLFGLVMQALVLALVAAAIGSAIAALAVPLFPLPSEIEPRAYLMLPLLAVSIGFVASLAGVRRIVQVDPASAFG